MRSTPTAFHDHSDNIDDRVHPLSRFLCAAIAALVVMTALHARVATAEESIRMPYAACHGLICLSMDADGQKETVILDTGNVVSVATQEMAARHHWKTHPYLDKDGRPVGDYTVTDPVALSLGGMNMSVKFFVVPAKDLGPSDAPYGATISSREFDGRILRINYVAHTFEIPSSISGEDKAVGDISNITFGAKGPPVLVLAPFVVSGHSFAAQFDTAFTGSVLIFDGTFPDAPFPARACPGGGATRIFPYTDGGAVTKCASVAEIAAGTEAQAHWNNLLVDLPVKGVHQPDHLFGATVGNQLFTGKILTLDLPHAKWYLQDA